MPIVASMLLPSTSSPVSAFLSIFLFMQLIPILDNREAKQLIPPTWDHKLNDTLRIRMELTCLFIRCIIMMLPWTMILLISHSIRQPAAMILLRIRRPPCLFSLSVLSLRYTVLILVLAITASEGQKGWRMPIPFASEAWPACHFSSPVHYSK